MTKYVTWDLAVHENVVLGAEYLWIPGSVAFHAAEVIKEEPWSAGADVYSDTDSITMFPSDMSGETSYGNGVVEGPLEKELAAAIVGEAEVRNFVELVGKMVTPGEPRVEPFTKKTYPTVSTHVVAVVAGEVVSGGKFVAEVEHHVVIRPFNAFSKPVSPKEAFRVFENLEKRYFVTAIRDAKLWGEGPKE